MAKQLLVLLQLLHLPLVWLPRVLVQLVPVLILILIRCLVLGVVLADCNFTGCGDNRHGVGVLSLALDHFPA